MSCNHINVRSSDVLVVLPGGEGTCSEFRPGLEQGGTMILCLEGHKLAGRSAAQPAEVNERGQSQV